MKYIEGVFATFGGVAGDGDENSIIFDVTGAIDFSEQVNIELSKIEKEGFTEIFPLDFYSKISTIKHIKQIVDMYFSKIVNRIPHVSDRTESVKNRFTKVYYKCYKKYYHSHWRFDKMAYDPLSLEDAIEYIKKNNLDIRLPLINK